MGFFDFLKRKKEKEESEKIKPEELESWVKKKKGEIEDKEGAFLKLAKNRVFQLVQELEEETRALETIKIGDKKVEEKAKIIVKENLSNYVVYLKKLTENLKSLDAEKPGKVVEKINLFFSDFEKKSSLSFQKATYLIGKELEDVKNSISSFFKEFKGILEENKELIEKSKIVNAAKEEADKYSKIGKIKEQVKENIMNIGKSISSLEDEAKILNKDIEKIKRSREYEEEEEKEGGIEKNKAEMKKEIYQLREMINLRLLADRFHSDEKKMQVIRQYKENFSETFEKDNGAEILALLGEAKINKEEISKKIKSIIEKKNEIENIPVIIVNKNKIQELEAEKRKMALEIENLNSEKSREEKKIERLEKTRQEIIISVKENLAKMNVELE